MRSKKLFTGIATLAMLGAMFLTACGGSTSSGGAVSYSGNISIWDNWDGKYVQYKQAIIDAYTKLHPNVKITQVNQADDTKIIKGIDDGTGADILFQPGDHIGTLAKASVIIPVDSYFSQSFLSANYSKASGQLATYGGHVYGLPEVSESVTIMYNTALLQSADIPKTTDDLATYVTNFATAHAGKYGLVWSVNDVYYNAAFYYGFGAPYMDEQGNSSLNTPAGIAAAKYIQGFNKVLPKDLDGKLAASLFSDGKAAMIIDGPWAYAGYKAALGDKVGFAVLPTVTATGKPLSAFAGGKVGMVTTLGSKHNEKLMADFLKFYTNKDNQVTMCTATGEIPTNLAALADPTIKSNTIINGFANQVANDVPFPNTPFMSTVWGPAGKAYTAIWQNQATPEDALKQAQDAINKAVTDLKNAG